MNSVAPIGDTGNGRFGAGERRPPAWQDRVIRPFATVLGVAGTLVVLSVMVTSAGGTPLTWFALAVVGTIGALRWRQAAWQALAAVTAVSLGLISVLAPSQSGLQYAPFAVASIAVVVAAAFFGKRAALAATFVFCGSLLIDGYGFAHGWFVLPTTTQTLDMRFWLRAALVFGVVGAALATLVAGAVASLEDAVTESHRTLDQLRVEQRERSATEARLSLAVEASGTGLWDWDIVSGSTYYSPMLMRLLGLPDGALGDRVDPFLDLVHPDDLPMLRTGMDAHLVHRVPYEIEYRVKTANRGHRWFRARGQAAWDDSGTAIRFSGSLTDVTDPRLAAEALRDSKASLRAFIDALPGPAVMIGPDLRLMAANQAFAALYSAPNPDTLIGEDGFSRMPSPLREQRLAQVQQAFNTGQTTRIEDTGHGITWANVICPVVDDAGRVLAVAVFAFDVSERRAAEAAREQSLSLTLATIESTADGILVVGHDGAIQLFNKTFERMWRFGDGELARLDDDRAIASVLGQLEDPESFVTRVRSLYLNPEEESFDTLVLKDGRVLERYSRAQRIDGKPVGRVWSFRDVTERQRSDQEIRRLNSELEARVARRTAELEAKNRALETFTYSVSHDLKAPLRAIDGYSRLLLEEHGQKLDDEGRRFVDNVRHGTQQMARLIEDLLTYSRLERRDVRAEPVDLRVVVAAVLAERASEIADRGVTVTVDVPALTVAADREGLTMALRNLIENALKFTQRVASPAVTVTGFERDTAWGLTVADNGVGFDMKFHDRIFDIFQRLHRAEDYPGTGVGLAIVRKAMERMGGTVRAESRLDAGATFFLEGPR